jgi:hypothetical protein
VSTQHGANRRRRSSERRHGSKLMLRSPGLRSAADPDEPPFQLVANEGRAAGREQACSGNRPSSARCKGTCPPPCSDVATTGSPHHCGRRTPSHRAWATYQPGVTAALVTRSRRGIYEGRLSRHAPRHRQYVHGAPARGPTQIALVHYHPPPGAYRARVREWLTRSSWRQDDSARFPSLRT